MWGLPVKFARFQGPRTWSRASLMFKLLFFKGVSGLRSPQGFSVFWPIARDTFSTNRKMYLSWKIKQVQYSFAPSLTITGGVVKPCVLSGKKHWWVLICNPIYFQLLLALDATTSHERISVFGGLYDHAFKTSPLSCTRFFLRNSWNSWRSWLEKLEKLVKKFIMKSGCKTNLVFSPSMKRWF